MGSVAPRHPTKAPPFLPAIWMPQCGSDPIVIDSVFEADQFHFSFDLDSQ